MKKIIEVFGVSFLVALLTALPVSTETLNFVTTLSSPVGVFSRLDMLDSSSQLDAQDPSLTPTINFCNKKSDNSGGITVQGYKSSTDEQILVSNFAIKSNSALDSHSWGAVSRWVISSPINIKNTAMVNVRQVLLTALTHVKTNNVSAPVRLMVGSSQASGILTVGKTTGNSSGEVTTGGLRTPQIQIGSPNGSVWFPKEGSGNYSTDTINKATWQEFDSNKTTFSGTRNFSHVLRWGAN